MITAIMQPTYFPWIGYFDLIDQSDTFVFYDDVQVVKRSWNVRNKIINNNNELFLTIPIKKTRHRDKTLFTNAVINYDEKWSNNHLKSIESSYKKAPQFDRLIPVINDIFSIEYPTLGAFTTAIIISFSKLIGIKTDFIFSSSLENTLGTKDERLVSVCKQINAKTYLSTIGSSKYIEKSNPGGAFPKNNLDIYYHNYEHPIYNQFNSKSFVSHVGVIDLLMNVSFDKALKTIRSGRKDMIYYLDLPPGLH